MAYCKRGEEFGSLSSCLCVDVAVTVLAKGGYQLLVAAHRVWAGSSSRSNLCLGVRALVHLATDGALHVRHEILIWHIRMSAGVPSPAIMLTAAKHQ